MIRLEHVTMQKTENYDIVSDTTYYVWSESNTLLGEIRWFDIRQQYCFFSNGAIVYDADQIADIVTFIEELNKEQRQNG